MKLFLEISAAILLCIQSASAFGLVAPSIARTASAPSTASSSALSMAKDEDLLRKSRSSRAAGNDDNLVELTRPLGLVLNQDDDGNVYVETVAPRGNAARTGRVKEGDIVTMCSATFGDDMWSTRGVGLTRVLAAIRVRAGPYVKLVFESPNKYEQKAAISTKQAQVAEEARMSAQAKKDQLLNQLEKDETKLKKGKFLGLF